MTGRVNAMEAIDKALVANEWGCIHQEEGAGPRAGYTAIYLKNDHRLTIHFKLYGSTGSMRVCNYYGTGEPINWGVTHATLSRADADEWTLVHTFTGPKKRQRLIAFAKTGVAVPEPTRRQPRPRNMGRGHR